MFVGGEPSSYVQNRVAKRVFSSENAIAYLFFITKIFSLIRLHVCHYGDKIRMHSRMHIDIFILHVGTEETFLRCALLRKFVK